AFINPEKEQLVLDGRTAQGPTELVEHEWRVAGKELVPRADILRAVVRKERTVKRICSALSDHVDVAGHGGTGFGGSDAARYYQLADGLHTDAGIRHGFRFAARTPVCAVHGKAEAIGWQAVDGYGAAG